MVTRKSKWGGIERMGSTFEICLGKSASQLVSLFFFGWESCVQLFIGPFIWL